MMTRNFWKNGHNYSNLAQCYILFYMHQWPMVPDHGTQYEENRFSHHGGMHNNGHPDGWMARLTDRSILSYIPRLCLIWKSLPTCILFLKAMKPELEFFLLCLQGKQYRNVWLKPGCMNYCEVFGDMTYSRYADI